MSRELGVSLEEFERIVAEFESHWTSQGEPEIESFVDVSAPHASPLLVELIRVDMEFRARRQNLAVVADYQSRLAPNFCESQLGELVFEEYRLRQLHGEHPDASALCQEYQIDFETWCNRFRPRVSDRCEANKSKAPLPRIDEGSLTDPDFPNAVHNAMNNAEHRSGFPEVGECFHGFELVGVLGQGAFGKVFLARETELSHRLVALKVTGGATLEPQSLAQLQHSNIIPIYSLKDDGERQSICMPFLGIATLADVMGQATKGKSNHDPRRESMGAALISTAVGRRAHSLVDTVSPSHLERVGHELKSIGKSDARLKEIEGFGYLKTILWLVCQVADGLHYAHGRGIMHGDLKPANILISDDGRPLILDFHLSRSSVDPGQPSPWVGGTLPYMSPEHLRAMTSETGPSPESDIFSFGVVLYEALTGRFPYASYGDSDQDLERMASERESLPEMPSKYNRAISPDLESIVMHCLATRPATGYRHAGELHSDLHRHLHHFPLRHAPSRSWIERCQKWVRRHPIITSQSTLGIAAALCIAVLCTVFWVVSAKQAQAVRENESRSFVAALDKLQQPLWGDSRQPVPVSSVASIDLVLTDRVFAEGDGVTSYRNLLEGLPEELAAKEIQRVGYAQYLLAYRAWTAAEQNSSEPQRERGEDPPSEWESDPLQRLEFVESLYYGKPPRAVVELKADILESRGAKEAARAIRDQVAVTDDLFLEAIHEFRANHFSQAIDKLRQLLAADPTRVETWLLRARCQEKMMNREAAASAFSTFLIYHPESYWGYVYRGMFRLKGREFQLARQDFDRAIELRPEEPIGYLNRSMSLRGEADWEAALKDLDLALELGTRQTRVFYLRSELLNRLGQSGLARESMRQFLSREPEDEKSWLTRGMVYVRQRQYQRALADFQSALSSNPDSIDAFQNIAALQAECLGNQEAAIEALNQILLRRQGDRVSRVTRGVLFARIGLDKQAYEDADEVMRGEPDADLCYRAAGIYALTSQRHPADRERSISLLKQAFFADPQRVASQIQSDRDLEALATDKEFKQLVQIVDDFSSREQENATSKTE